MAIEDPAPHFAPSTRSVAVGGMTKAELLVALQRHHVQLNESAERLFAHDGFAPAATRAVLETVACSVGALGFAQGAVIADIYARAVALGLALCPLELGPHLRLQYLDQPEDQRQALPHQAPPGSLTVVSAQLADDDAVPKGFYLRCIGGVLWLRGYRSAPEHVWGSDDHLIFCRP